MIQIKLSFHNYHLSICCLAAESWQVIHEAGTGAKLTGTESGMDWCYDILLIGQTIARVMKGKLDAASLTSEVGTWRSTLNIAVAHKNIEQFQKRYVNFLSC